MRINLKDLKDFYIEEKIDLRFIVRDSRIMIKEWKLYEYKF